MNTRKEIKSSRFWVNGPFQNSYGFKIWEVEERRFAGCKHYAISTHYTAHEADMECRRLRAEERAPAK